MGNCNFDDEKFDEGMNGNSIDNKGISLNTFQLHFIVGYGGFGKVI